MKQLMERLNERFSGLPVKMSGYIKLEWSRWKREIITELIVLALVPLLLLCGYLPAKTLFFQLSSALRILPPAICAFLGLPPNIGASNYLFFVQFIMMMLVIFLALRKCRQAVLTLWWDEKNRSASLWLNQLFSRREFFMVKYIWLVGSFILEYLLWHLFLMLLMAVGGANSDQRLSGVSAMGRSLFQGLFVFLLLLSASYLYAAVRRAADFAEHSFANRLVFATLVLGNLYKLRDLVIWAGGLFNENTSLAFPLEAIERAFGWLEGLRWLSPLSWLNPYVAAGGGVFWGRIFLCAVLAGAMTYGGNMLYQKRNLAA